MAPPGEAGGELGALKSASGVPQGKALTSRSLWEPQQEDQVVWESGNARALEAETNSEMSRCVFLKPTCWGFPGSSVAKEAACNQEARIQSLGWEIPLEEMAAHSSTLAWRIPRTE